MLMYYSGQTSASTYNSLFESGTARPYKLFYVLAAINELYKLDGQVAVDGNDASARSVAAKGEQGCAAMLLNRGEAAVLSLDLVGTDAKEFELLRINESESLDQARTVTAKELASLAVGHDEIVLVKSK